MVLIVTWPACRPSNLGPVWKMTSLLKISLAYTTSITQDSITCPARLAFGEQKFQLSIKIVSLIHVLPGAVAGFGRTHDLGQVRRFKVHVTLILMIQHCSYFNVTIKFSLNLGFDFTNIPRRHSPTLSNRHFWSKGQLNDFVVHAMISQDFSNFSIVVF